MHLKKIFSVLKTAYKKWLSKDQFRESAVIAYYSIFSLPGLLLIIITLASIFFGHDIVNRHLTMQFTSAMGADAAAQIQNIIAKATERQDSVWATIIAIVTILLGATGVFAQFQKSLNIIWEVKAVESKLGIWNLVRTRLFSFGLIISIGFILIVSLIITAALSAFGTWLSAYFSDSLVVILQIVNSIISLCIISLLFALIFKFIPDAKIQWRHVWIGAFVTALMFEIGKFGLGLYFGKANPGIGYGSAGSIILILLWVSYSSMIVFFGAEFTRAYTAQVSGKIQPTKIAVKDPGREK